VKKQLSRRQIYSNQQLKTDKQQPSMTEGHPIQWTTREILDATKGELLWGDLHHSFSQVSIDSRKITSQDVFVAIRGDFHDGHAFVSNAVDQGVSGVVVNHNKLAQLPVEDWKKKEVACIAVADTTRALGDLAAFNRRRAQASVVAVTGSNGKTSTRRLTAGVLSRQYRTLATTGNLNNEIGLPLTLLRLESGHRMAVVELGTNHPGEIARLAAICSPDIGVITNIGPAHLEGLGSLDGVMREKGDLLKHLGQNGRAVLNADDPLVMQLARNTEIEVILFGLSAKASIRAEEIVEKGLEIDFKLIFPEESVPVHLNCPGRFMTHNALAAAAVGYLQGLSPKTVKAGLEGFTPVSGRMNIVHMRNGIHIIDDTYNANPESMAAALSTLKSMRTGGRGFFVAGDMLELGSQARSLHREIGALAARSGISRLCATGEHADTLAAGACDEGMQPAETMTGSRDNIVEDLKIRLQPGDWVLVKGSRGMAMEKVVRELIAWGGKNGG
jgi:UDP-N-acetylmuramoyl-tripeptide--D-alanyl-D-alanine ligase